MQLTRVFLEPNTLFPESPSLDFYFKVNTSLGGYWGYFTTISNNSNKRYMDYMKNNHDVFANYVNKNSELVPIKGK